MSKVARGKINPKPGESPLKVAIQFDDEWVFAQIQRIAVENNVSFASVARRLVSDGLAVNGIRRPKKSEKPEPEIKLLEGPK